MTRTKNEKGGVLVELTITLVILFTFYAGALSLHRSASRRFRAIVDHRNSSIEKIRQTKAKFLPSR